MAHWTPTPLLRQKWKSTSPQLWDHHTNVLPTEKPCFIQLLKSEDFDHRTDWPYVGMSTVEHIEADIAWDHCPDFEVPTSEPLLVSPIDRIVRTVIPGIQFTTNLHPMSRNTRALWVQKSSPSSCNLIASSRYIAFTGSHP
jgi:hypothetical protein